ncbi:MAG: hypothetical protein AAF849_22540 [Bacteroidota bacterium]
MYLAPLNYDRFFKKVFSDKRIAKQFLEDFFGFTIEEIELMPLDHKLTNESSLLSFDYRCKINDKFIIIDMQQWYKHDVVKRFYMYHTANTVLQLEGLPFKTAERERKVKDYSELLPVITLVWMVDDGLKFDRDYTAYTFLPTVLLNFLQDEPLWEKGDCDPILKKRAEVLKIMNNDAKNLSFLRENQLIFAFQNYIIKNEESKDKRYTRWFEFAAKTRDSENTEEDFREFEDDPVFSELIRKLSHKSLDSSDWDYIRYYDEMLGVMEAKVRDSREEGREEGKQKGEQIGKIKTSIEFAVNFIKRYPSWKNEQISEMTGFAVEVIPQIRTTIQAPDSDHIEILIATLFKDVSGLNQKDVAALKQWLMRLFDN